MRLYEEAARISILGIEGYAYGLHIAVGMAAIWIAAGILSRQKQMKKGTATLLTLSGLLIGGFISRLFFCIMDQSLGMSIPFSAWFLISGGGWSLSGMTLGFFIAAWFSAKISQQNAWKTLDIASCAFPLLIIAERLGDRLIEDFNTSRPLEEGWLADSFLAVRGEYETYLRTYYLAAFTALVLFLILNGIAIRNRKKDGDIFITFLLLFGASGIVLESLRYDYFLSITFVHLQQVIYALFLLAGSVLASVRGRGKHGNILRWASPASVIMIAGVIIGIEFAIDRSDINNVLLYLLMVVILFIPVLFGMMLMKEKGKTDR